MARCRTATLFVLLLLFLCNSCGYAALPPTPSKIISAVSDGSGGFKIVSGAVKGAILRASFTDRINTSGWSFLHITDLRKIIQNKGVLDEDVAFLAGQMEAYLTAPLIRMHWQNTMGDYCASPSDYCTKLQDFVSKSVTWMSTLSAEVGYQASLWLNQLKGLQSGYHESGEQAIPMDNALMLLQIQGDLEDLEAALGAKSDDIGSRVRGIGSGSCSALVKLLPGYKELYVAHDTWGDYTAMLRIFKRYDLKFDIGGGFHWILPGGSQAFSSYPGVLHSMDDYYLLGSKLVTMETTIGNSNPDLWKYVTPNALFEGIRVVIANRLATSGETWTKYFSMFNMGTYNNQWMVVDYNKFNIGENITNGTLWIVEQIPGNITSGDQTDILRKQLYWPSFNIPFYKNIFNISGAAQLAQQYGDWFTWDGSPRAKIFARNHTSVTNITTMIKLMRYNNFQHDPLSQCNCTPPYSGENSISARSDLNPSNGTYPFDALGHRRHGGTDCKVTSFGMMNSTRSTLSCLAISGPTYDQQPVFQWSTSGFTPVPLGHPDKWDFPIVNVKWN